MHKNCRSESGTLRKVEEIIKHDESVLLLENWRVRKGNKGVKRNYGYRCRRKKILLLDFSLLFQQKHPLVS